MHLQELKRLFQGVVLLALACSPLASDDHAVPGERCDSVGASRCAARSGKGLLYCDDSRVWRAGACPGRQVCTSDGEQAACRDSVDECFDKPEATRFCRDNAVHVCSADWSSTLVETTCEGEKPACVGGVCLVCRPDSRRCSPAAPYGPQLCSEEGVWVEQTPCAAPTDTCVFGDCKSPDTFGTACRTADNVVYEVEWIVSDTPTTFKVRSIGGSGVADGWTLRYRPPQIDGPLWYFMGDVTHSDGDVFRAVVPRPSIPSVNAGLGATEAPVSILTCPDGTCVASPVTRECKTVYADTEPAPAPRSRRVAVVGDELLRENQTCRPPVSPAVAPCAPTLGELLHNQGYASWITYHEASDTRYLWLHAAREQASTRPDVLVLAVATHDAWRLASLPYDQRQTQLLFSILEVKSAIDAVRAENANAKVVIVTASERGPPDYSAAAVALNEELWKIRDQPKYVGHVLVARWQTVVTEQCGSEWLSPTGPKCELFEDDQIHLSAAGDIERNGFIAFAVYYAFNPLPTVQNRLE